LLSIAGHRSQSRVIIIPWSRQHRFQLIDQFWKLFLQQKNKLKTATRNTTNLKAGLRLHKFFQDIKNPQNSGILSEHDFPVM